MRQWLPIPLCLFEAAILHLPNPLESNLIKMDLFFPKSSISMKESSVYQIKEEMIENCKGNFSQFSPVYAYISKMVGVPLKNIGENLLSVRNKATEDNNEVVFVAFARVFCGQIKRGQELYLIGPKHDPKNNNYDIQKLKFDNLYFFMGQYLEPVNEVPVGNIFSIYGIENYVYKGATISSIFECPSLVDLNISVFF